RLLRRREIGRYGHRHRPTGEPLDGAEDQRLLVGTAHALRLYVVGPDVAEGRTVHPALTVGDDPLERPVLAVTRVAAVGEDLDVPRGAAGVVINFEAGRLPDLGQPLVDRVIAERVDEHVAARRVAGVVALARRD